MFGSPFGKGSEEAIRVLGQKEEEQYLHWHAEHLCLFLPSTVLSSQQTVAP